MVAFALLGLFGAIVARADIKPDADPLVMLQGFARLVQHEFKANDTECVGGDCDLGGHSGQLVGLARQQVEDTQQDWQCHYYGIGEDDQWCQTVGTKDGWVYEYNGGVNGKCGSCWCCKKPETPSTIAPTSAPTSVPTMDTREGELNFCGSSVLTNNLGNAGPSSGNPVVRYRGISENVDLIVTNLSQYIPWNVNANGKDTDCYGAVSLKCGEVVSLRFGFVDQLSSKPIKMKSFYFTLVDIDQGLSNRCKESIEVEGFSSFSTTANSQLQATTDLGVTRFAASQQGTADDNPDSAVMTGEQADRSVEFLFTDIQAFTVTMSTQTYQPESDDLAVTGYAGRKLMFTGKSTLSATPASLLATGKSARATPTCTDLLVDRHVWGGFGRGIDVSKYTGGTMSFMGCNGNGCLADSFYCSDTATGGITFGTTGILRALVGATATAYADCCTAAVPNGICNAPDKDADIQALCTQMGFSRGIINAKKASSFCPQVHYDGGAQKWTSHYVNSTGSGHVFTCEV